MVKLITIFKKIPDLKAFEEYFIKEIYPVLLNVPGVERVNISSVFQMRKEASQTINGIELIIETYFESQEALNNIIESPLGVKVMELSLGMPGEVSTFIGKEKKLL